MTALARIAPAPAAPPAAHEIAFTKAEFSALAAIVQGESGIVLPTAKQRLVSARLVGLFTASGAASFAEYLRRVHAEPAERARVIEALTTNHTRFFREHHHVEHLLAEGWPALAERARTGGRVRIWSAACFSGQEPYTLAMCLLGTDRRTAGRLGGADVAILASDLDTNVLATARAGLYGEETAADVPAALRALWMQPNGDGRLRMADAVRRLVRFRQLNLLARWPMARRFDAIFCRNVMIYFDDPTKEALQRRFADQLEPGGFLYLGHSERLLGAATGLFDALGHTVYRRRA